MPSCPACGRSVAVVRPSCLYCGAALAPGSPAARAYAVDATPEPAPAASAAPARVLVLLELASIDERALAEALGLPFYEAGLLARRGGIHLVRAAIAREAEAERDRLAALGARAFAVPEQEVRAAPVACLGGERRGEAFVLRTASGTLTLGAAELLAVVRGPIAREYQTGEARRRGVAIARPAEGYRFQLHRRDQPRPLEIDTLNFELGFAARGSVRLEVDGWLETVKGRAPVDDGFARLSPALAPAAAETGGPLAAAGTLRAGRAEGEARLVLDNLGQFRFYSGCVAALQRRR
jgi:hypothetical protein